MDIYKKQKIRTLILALIFVVGVVLQIWGHSIKGYVGLAVQIVSVVILLIDLYLYNKKYK